VPPEGKHLLDKVELSKSTLQLFENGLAFAKLLKELNKIHSKVSNR